MEQNPQQEENILVKISDIMKKIKSKEDMTNCMRERGNNKYNIFRVVFSKGAWIRWKIFPSSSYGK